QDIGDVRRDDKFDRKISEHHPRHAIRQATITRVVALATAGLVRQARIENGLILRREWSLLAPTARLGRVPLETSDSRPFAPPRRIHRIVECGRPGYRE